MQSGRSVWSRFPRAPAFRADLIPALARVSAVGASCWIGAGSASGRKSHEHTCCHPGGDADARCNCRHHRIGEECGGQRRNNHCNECSEQRALVRREHQQRREHYSHEQSHHGGNKPSEWKEVHACGSEQCGEHAASGGEQYGGDGSAGGHARSCRTRSSVKRRRTLALAVMVRCQRAA